MRLRTSWLSGFYLADKMHRMQRGAVIICSPQRVQIQIRGICSEIQHHTGDSFNVRCKKSQSLQTQSCSNMNPSVGLQKDQCNCTNANIMTSQVCLFTICRLDCLYSAVLCLAVFFFSPRDFSDTSKMCLSTIYSPVFSTNTVQTDKIKTSVMR